MSPYRSGSDSDEDMGATLLAKPFQDGPPELLVPLLTKQATLDPDEIFEILRRHVVLMPCLQTQRKRKMADEVVRATGLMID